MFKFFRKIFDYKKQIKDLKYKTESLIFDLKHSLSISEKYFPYMKTTDKIQLLILRRNLWIKK